MKRKLNLTIGLITLQKNGYAMLIGRKMKMKWAYKFHQSVQKRNQKRHQNNNTSQAAKTSKIMRVVRPRKNNEQKSALQEKEITVVIKLKNTFSVNAKPLTLSFAQVEVVACNTIYSWLLLLTIKSSIMTENNASVNEVLEEQLYIENMVPLNSMEASKSSERTPISFPLYVSEERL